MNGEIPAAVAVPVHESVDRETIERELAAPGRSGWIGFVRVADGLGVAPLGVDQSWTVLPGPRDDRPSLVCCPLCEGRLCHPEAAMKVAELAYPPL